MSMSVDMPSLSVVSWNSPGEWNGMASTVTVDLGERSYDILVGGDECLLQSLPVAGGKKTRGLVVSDANVDPLYGDWCEDALSERGWLCERHVIDAGEPSKSLATMSELYDHAAELELERRSLVVALGGGVVGDLSGFLAASYLRGVPFVQVPTSLLAMVDSSVGGKTGINLPTGKNLVGAFYQPEAVAVNLDVLQTLPEREYAAGIAEVIKYGVICDAAFFGMLESNADRIVARDRAVMADVVARCCEIKADVVSRDEKEGGVRATLNFGHTLGHALEAVSGYGGWLHGEAVAAGMVYAARISERERGFPAAETERLVGLLHAVGLPCDWRAARDGLEWPAIRGAMSRDKKTRGTIPRFVLADRIGESVFGCVVAEDVLSAVFTAA